MKRKYTKDWHRTVKKLTDENPTLHLKIGDRYKSVTNYGSNITIVEIKSDGVYITKESVK